MWSALLHPRRWYDPHCLVKIDLAPFGLTDFAASLKDERRFALPKALGCPEDCEQFVLGDFGNCASATVSGHCGSQAI
jgi:hypothetical protein